MKFQKVTTLSPGTRYKIILFKMHEYYGTFIRTKYINETCHIKCFKNIYGYCGVNMPFKEEFNGSTGMFDYYAPIFQRDKIQSDMEHRAVNILLRIITGDPTFSW